MTDDKNRASDPEVQRPGLDAEQRRLKERFEGLRSPVDDDERSRWLKILSIKPSDFGVVLPAVERAIYMYKRAEDTRTQRSGQQTKEKILRLSRHFEKPIGMVDELGPRGQEMFFAALAELSEEDPTDAFASWESQSNLMAAAARTAAADPLALGHPKSSPESILVARVLLSLYRAGIAPPKNRIPGTVRRFLVAALNYAGYIAKDPRVPVREGHRLALENVAK